jgi:hypothetical protein
MANKKISELQSRTPALSDLMLVGDPSSGYSYKCTVTALATIIETDIADGYVTIGTTQTISGAKTFSNNLTLTSVVNTPTDPDKFLTLNASNVVTYRTGAEVLSDIGGVGGSGTTNYLPKFSATTTLANSQIFDNGTNVGIGVGSSIIAGYLLTIGGKVKIYNQIDLDNPTTNTCNAINIQKGTSISHRGVGYIQIASFNTNRLSLFFNDNNNYQADFDGSNLTTGQRYILPNATGTLALTSDLSSYVPTSRILTINGTSYDLSANRTWSVGTVTSVAALTLGTTGTDLSSSVANGTTTPVITLNIPTASATNRGALSSTDWSTFNNKQSTITLTTTGSSGSATFVSNTLNVPTYTLAGLGGISGTGTTNYIPKFTSSSAIGNSVIYESGGSIGINTISPNATLEVNGSFNSTDGTSTIRITNSGGLGLFGTVGSHPLVFRTVNTERMRLDASGNLGLGTSSPATKLDVNGNISVTNGNYISLASNNPTYTRIYRSGALIIENNSNQLTYSDAGNLGLGVSPSAWASGYKAFQFGNSSAAVSALFSNGPNDFWSVSNAYFDGTSFKYITTGTATGYEQVNGSHKWYQVASGSGGASISFTQAMTLDASGRLGIGKTSIAHPLDVNGIARFDAAAGAGRNTSFISRYSNDDNYTLTLSQVVSSGLVQYSFDTKNNGTTYLNNLVLDRGNVGIGTISPTSRLHIYGTTDATQRIIADGSGNNSSLHLNYNGSNVGFINSYQNTELNIGTSVSAFVNFYTNNSERMRITSGGNVGIGSSNPQEKFVVSNGSSLNIEINPSYIQSFNRTSATYNDLSFFSSTFIVNTGTSPTERMRITSGGELLINTTSDAGDYKLQVNGNSYASGNIVITDTKLYYLRSDVTGEYALQTRDLDFRIIGSNDATTQRKISFGYYTSNNPAGTWNEKVFINSYNGNFETAGSIKTAAPSGGTAKPWKLGEAGVTLGGSNTSGVRVEIDGTVYYLVTGYLP